MLGAQKQDKLIERERAQRFKLLDKLQAVNNRNASLKKQLAGGNVASVTANLVANYRPCGIKPKNQLTGTDLTAHVPWKWAVNNKLCVDAVMYPEEKN